MKNLPTLFIPVSQGSVKSNPPKAVLVRKQGAALVVVLLLVMVIGGISTLMFSRTVGEIKNSASNASIVQTLMLARGSAAVGGNLLSRTVSHDLNDILKDTYSRSDRWAFGGNAIGSAPDAQQVANDLNNKVAQDLQDKVDAQLCNLNLPSVNGGSVSLRIYFTDTSSVCGNNKSLPSGISLSSGRFVSGSPRDGTTGSAQMQTYALPFVMVSEASLGQYRRNVVLQGEYRFNLGVSSFARYALFTNIHTTQDGTPIWFNDRTSFNGPIHTNQNFRFYGHPTFGGQVTSAGCVDPRETDCHNNAYNQGGIFYGENGGGVIAPENMAPSSTAPSYVNTYGTHQPNLSGGVAWNEAFIPMPTNADPQRSVAQNGGLYFNYALSELKLYAGDASKNPLTQSGNDWIPNPAPYQYIRACDASSVCTLYRFGTDKALYQENALGNWVKVKNNFNGMIFSEGNIDNLTGPPRDNSDKGNPDTAPPAIAAFAKLTVANAGSGHNIQIQSDLKYESVPCPESLNGNSNATCSNLDAQNVLGVYTQEGDILVGDGTDNSPQDLTIHAVLMSGRGSVTVQNYDSISPRGKVKLLGGLISNYYGGFGKFDATSGLFVHGYGREFTYDQRMALGTAPPYFPGVSFKEGGTPVVISFGQREQVY